MKNQFLLPKAVGRMAFPTGLLSISTLPFRRSTSSTAQNHSFLRLFALARSCVWQKWAWAQLLKSSETGGGSFRMLGGPEQAVCRA